MLPLLVPLTPDPESDVILPEVKLAVDPSGKRAVQKRGRWSPQNEAFFWAIDTQGRTYRLFKLTGTDADARRIYAYLQRFGSPVSLERIRQSLADALARQPSRGPTSRRGSEPRPGGFIAFNGFDSCFGHGDVAIETWDPAAIVLTRTDTWADWTRDPYWFNWWAGGGCWANPNTGFSTWIWDTCGGSISSRYDYLDVATDGSYHNDDFGDPNQRTWVFQLAAVNYSNGFVSWSTFHYDEGEFSWLIFGVTQVGGMGTTCWPT